MRATSGLGCPPPTPPGCRLRCLIATRDRTLNQRSHVGVGQPTGTGHTYKPAFIANRSDRLSVSTSVCGALTSTSASAASSSSSSSSGRRQHTTFEDKWTTTGYAHNVRALQQNRQNYRRNRRISVLYIVVIAANIVPVDLVTANYGCLPLRLERRKLFNSVVLRQSSHRGRHTKLLRGKSGSNATLTFYVSMYCSTPTKYLRGHAPVPRESTCCIMLKYSYSQLLPSDKCVDYIRLKTRIRGRFWH